MAVVMGGLHASPPADSAAVAAVAKDVEYQKGVQKLVDLWSKLNPVAREFIPSSAAVSSLSRKALSEDAPVFDYNSIGSWNRGGKESGVDAYQQHRVKEKNIGVKTL